MPLTDPLTFCCLCIIQKPETEQHLFWDCDFAKRLWDWLAHIIQLRTGSLWRPQLHHALLGNKVPKELQRIQTWWELLRGSMIWFIWIHRNAQVFRAPTARQSQTALASLVWVNLHTYIKIDHRRTQKSLKTASLRRAESLEFRFTFNWGDPPSGPLVMGTQLILPPIPALALLQ
jgi:hypothetical protein